MAEKIVRVREEGLTLDRVCWRHYGTTAGTVELLLDRNPGLAAHGIFLPVGLNIILPDFVTAPVQGSVKLWEDRAAKR